MFRLKQIVAFPQGSSYVHRNQPCVQVLRRLFSNKESPYKVLGIPENSTQEEIKSSYTALMKTLQLNSANSSDTPSRLTEVQHAFETLTNKSADSLYRPKSWKSISEKITKTKDYGKPAKEKVPVYYYAYPTVAFFSFYIFYLMYLFYKHHSLSPKRLKLYERHTGTQEFRVMGTMWILFLAPNEKDVELPEDRKTNFSIDSVTTYSVSALKSPDKV